MELSKKQRIKDPKAIAAVRKDYCEIENCGRKATGEPHHIRPRSLGGSDIPANLIQLCFECHRLAHDGKITYHQLIRIVAKREGLEAEEVYRITGWPLPEVLPEQEKQEEPVSLEELVQRYVDLEERERECRWSKGQLLDVMVNAGAKISWIASQVGVSAAQVRELIKTYRAFMSDDDRNPELSWIHHRIAANSKDPCRWIERAADEQMSTRQLRKAILEKEATDEIKTIAIAEKEKEIRQAEKVYAKVEEVIARGGPGAELLKEKLRQLSLTLPSLRGRGMQEGGFIGAYPC